MATSRKKIDQRERRRQRRHQRVRKKVYGTAARPRMVVHRSSKHMRGQLVDDVAGKVLAGASTTSDDLGDEAGTTKSERSRAAGAALAERAKELGVERVVFDRGGYVYHGRVAAFAEGAREAGLDF